MRNKNRYIALALSLALAFPVGSLAQGAKEDPLKSSESEPLVDFLSQEGVGTFRIYGKNRYETSVEISKRMHNKQPLVIVASGENYPDALTASNLAGEKFPILLVGKDIIPSPVKEEIKRLDPDRIIVLGGDRVVSEKVENELKNFGQVERVFGKNRYETALEAAKISGRKGLLAVSGENFTDPLLSSGLAYANDQAMVLVGKDYSPEGLTSYIKENSIQAIDFVGGEDKVSAETKETISAESGAVIENVYQANDEFNSSVILAERLKATKGKDPETVIIARNDDYPDALCASVLADYYDAPILLSEKDGLSKEVSDFLEQNKDTIKHIVLVGGDRTLSQDLENSLDENLKKNYASLKSLDEPDLVEEVEIPEETVELNAESEGEYEADISENSSDFIWPLTASRSISSDYGQRVHPVTGEKQNFHMGVDIAAASGSEILAAKSGKVIFAGEKGTYGNLVRIDHGNGLETRYAHCSKILVSQGQQVSQGDKIALVGSTGRSTGPHLHFEVRENGEHVSPWNYLGK